MTPEFLNAHPLPFAKLIGLTVTRADKTLVEGEAIVAAGPVHDRRPAARRRGHGHRRHARRDSPRR